MSLHEALKKLSDLTGLTFTFPKDLQTGNTLEDLNQISQLSQVRYRQVQLPASWWKREGEPLLVFYGKDRIPAIAFWKEWQWSLYIPNVSQVKSINLSEADQIAPLAYVFYKTLPDKVTYFSLLKLGFGGAKKWISQYFLLGLIGTLLGLATPFLYKVLFDQVIPHSDYNTLSKILAVLVVIAITSLSFQITASLTILRIEGSAQNKLTAAVWDRFLRLPVSFFRKYGVGDLIQRTGMVEEVRKVLSLQTISTIFSALYALIYLVPMFYFSWQLALIGVTFTLLSFGVTLFFIIKRVPIQRALLKLNADINQYLLQLIQGIAKVRVAGAEHKAFNHWYEKFSNSLDLDYDLGKIQNIVMIISLALSSASLILIYATVFFLIENQINPNFTVGTFMAFNAAFIPFSMALAGLLSVIMTLILIVPYWERSKVIFDHTTEDAKTLKNTILLDGGFELKNVSFGYADQPDLIKDISFTVRQGEFIGIVGPSGAGKSTLLRLLLGFEQPASGTILYNGRDLESINKEHFRQQVGVVLQTSNIMTGTIYENILVGRQSSVEQIKKAIVASSLNEVISELPMGMDTILPSGGGTLSGGQKQRILLARALLSEPKMLLLDEATSALDNPTQKRIHANLDQLKVTRIVIAHSLSTLTNANKIYVLLNGRFIEEGTFQELNQKKGLFQNLVNFQEL